MKPQFIFCSLLGLITPLVIGCNSLSNNQPPSAPSSPQPSNAFSPDLPDVSFTVQTDSGNCPATVGVWEFMLGFEGGADHTVVADFSPVAQLPVEMVQSEDRRVVYEAPLQPEYSTCTGVAQSAEFSMYTFRFTEGKIQFTVDLTQGDGYRNIRYADISANRPYVHWRATN
ncbi:MAG: hypothetical protein F6K03_00735 [Kamptonema sp. SIO4C4]|nr:hypothetical protein [Kamptonema sp. SIO4C4]